MEHGILGALLYMGRIFGISPFSSLSTLQVSRAYSAYGKVLALISGSYLIVTPLEVVILRKYGIGWSITKILRRVCNDSVVYIVLFGMLRAPRRMARIGEAIQKINQINTILGWTIEDATGKILFVFIAYWISTLILRVVDTVIHIEEFIVDPAGATDGLIVTWIIFRIIIIIEYNIALMLSLHLAYFAWRLLSTILAINRRLETYITELSSSCQFIFHKNTKSAWESEELIFYKYFGLTNAINIAGTDHPRVTRKDTILKSIRELRNYYIDVCDILTTACDEDGVLLGLLIFFALSHLGKAVFATVLCLMTQAKASSYLIMSLVWFIVYGINLTMLSEPCHCTSVELRRTQMLVNTLRSTISSDEEGSNEVETFQRLLVLYMPSYRPLELCIIDRSLVLKIIGWVITSTLMVLSYGPDSMILNSLSS